MHFNAYDFVIAGLLQVVLKNMTYDNMIYHIFYCIIIIRKRNNKY